MKYKSQSEVSELKRHSNMTRFSECLAALAQDLAIMRYFFAIHHSLRRG
jgi:hypothetical protein